MTITQDISAPLIVVTGATGNQGGSVVRNLIDSDCPYRIRAISRDSNSASARALADIGVEVVVVPDLFDFAAIHRAFEGATYVYAMTPTGTGFVPLGDKEVELGKLYVDAAKAVDVQLFLWSGLDSYSANSKGKYKQVLSFETKHQVSVYARAHVPTIVVQPGYFATNPLMRGFAPYPIGDGTYVMSSALAPTTYMPLVDIAHDYGLFVRSAIESGAFKPGDDVLTCSEWITMNDIARTIAEETGKKVVYKQKSDEQMFSDMKKAGIPADVVPQYAEMVSCQREFGYYGDKDIKPSSAHLARPTRTWREFVRLQDWSKVLE